jgi:hypothetical protein
VVHHALERRGVPAKRNRGEIDHEIAGDDGRGDDPVVVVCLAHPGGSHPAQVVAGAIADLSVTEDDLFHIPSPGLELARQRSADALTGAAGCV